MKNQQILTGNEKAAANSQFRVRGIMYIKNRMKIPSSAPQEKIGMYIANSAKNSQNSVILSTLPNKTIKYRFVRGRSISIKKILLTLVLRMTDFYSICGICYICPKIYNLLKNFS